MNSVNSPAGRIADVVGSVRKKGVRLWSENGQLHYKAPKGTLTQDEIERLRISKSEIVAFLGRAPDAETTEPRHEPRRRFGRSPLAFSQLAHWHSYQLSERRAIRQIASATRLRGPLHVNALQKSIAEIVYRHDALRTRIVVLDGVPVQEISESSDFELNVADLAALSETAREAEVLRLIDLYILEPIDVAASPLFGLWLLRLREDEHVLIVAMEHMISDEISMDIVLRELFAAYTQVANGRAFSLPAIPVQFADHAVRQRDARKSWIEHHGAHWHERLTGCQRLRFPESQSLQTVTRSGWGTVPVKIERNLKAELREWCRVRRTTLVMGVFSAYVGLVLRWCDVSEAVIQYVIDGRASPEIENTIGYFASPLYVRIELCEDDSFVDLANRVTEEYCKAYEHADFCYMAAQVPRPEFTRNTAFNWVHRRPEIELCDDAEGAITCSPIHFAHPMSKKLAVDHEPSILLFDSGDEVLGDVHFPLNRFSIDSMEKFGRNFSMFIVELLTQPQRRVKDILLLR